MIFYIMRLYWKNIYSFQKTKACSMKKQRGKRTNTIFVVFFVVVYGIVEEDLPLLWCCFFFFFWLQRDEMRKGAKERKGKDWVSGSVWWNGGCSGVWPGEEVSMGRADGRGETRKWIEMKIRNDNRINYTNLSWGSINFTLIPLYLSRLHLSSLTSL